MKKYTAIIRTKTEGIDNAGRYHAYTYKYEADRLRDIYEQAKIDTCDYNGIGLAYIYDKQGQALKQIASIGREITVYTELDNEARQDAAVLYADHKADDVIAL